MSHRHSRLEPIVVDKQLDAEALAVVLNRSGRSANKHKPSRPYRGKYAADEDFSDVLQLGWEYEVAVLSADSKMLEKALRFERQFPNEESCLRGLILLPLGKKQQIDVLTRFVGGEIAITASQKGGVVPKTVDDLEVFNLAIDLRDHNPRVRRLCDCDD